MATNPFSTQLISRLGDPTSFRLTGQTGPVFTPRFFCCSDPNSLDIVAGKEPVADFTLDPNPAFVGASVNFDATGSYDPDGSVTGTAFTFQSGTPSSGTTSTGTVSWTSAGTFTVTLVVEDGTGLKSSPNRQIMKVYDFPPFEGYAATSAGVFYTNSGGSAWVDLNTGLSGDQLLVNDVKVHPATMTAGTASRTLWAATDGGLLRSNNGGQSWATPSPSTINDDYSDSPGPGTGDVTWNYLQFASAYMFAIARWQNGSTIERSYLLYTSDNGTTWGQV